MAWMAILYDMALLCLVIGSGDGRQIEGRTRLQKIVYFCQDLGWDIGDYRLHYYGPFSHGLASIIRDTESAGLITQTEKTEHTFELTEKGAEFLETFESNVKDGRVEPTKKLVSRIFKWSQKELELAATIDYVRGNNPDMEEDRLLDKVDSIKENYSREEIDAACGKWRIIKEIIRNQQVETCSAAP